MTLSPFTAVPLDIEDDLAVLPFAAFSRQFAQALAPLIRFTLGPALRDHPKWGRRMPFDVPRYGSAPSSGHVCRPDILLTAQGPKVCEMDFVPAGRGWLLAALPGESDRLAVVEEFAKWYAALGESRVYYATGTVTQSREETGLFARAMREMLGFDIRAVDIDTDRIGTDGLVDRLFYRSELAQPLTLDRHRVITAEPWLDSKMIFAVLHDREMTALLEESLGRENLSFLRQTCVESYLVEDVRDGVREDIRTADGDSVPGLQDRGEWVMKATEVENYWSWGSRSVVLGRTHTQEQWDAYLRGTSPHQKMLGHRPVLQRFAESLDFAGLWNAAIDGSLKTSDPTALGKSRDLTSRRPAQEPVVGRLGLSFLVSHVTGEVGVSPLGNLCLRQNPLAHMEGDALSMAFRPSPRAPR
ncbi:hypothetical protein [Streptomyces gilvosporeus]|uniref:Uncharacterized protein n=1 Tax=Streptomyces gilvosporeus TaxID=553510 RepID=A0A1V0TZC7_9ACTN|nr:hypothetical protein [Streptomyces gilvosporeus]ARF58140.1 hypothetical protein B1H19_31710 [Streptomyces gilvosporeus]